MTKVKVQNDTNESAMNEIKRMNIENEEDFRKEKNLKKCLTAANRDKQQRIILKGRMGKLLNVKTRSPLKRCK